MMSLFSWCTLSLSCLAHFLVASSSASFWLSFTWSLCDTPSWRTTPQEIIKKIWRQCTMYMHRCLNYTQAKKKGLFCIIMYYNGRSVLIIQSQDRTNSSKGHRIQITKKKIGGIKEWSPPPTPEMWSWRYPIISEWLRLYLHLTYH